MPTSSLSFLAQVGKTSLIMALVGEEFPEEVSVRAGAPGPPWAPSLGALPGSGATAPSRAALAGGGVSGRFTQLPGDW